ncbi:MAG: UbiA family prenyltransferase [Candidatus Nanohaloarchaea archaeon]|nr:UbiA family prenyltransferase [Candidatus Nanohaloarchaea archaeon]
MGIAVVGVLSAGVGAGNVVSAAVALVQVFLVQLHSFSMNNYYDARYWKENNYIQELLEHGTPRWKIYFYGHIPLLLAALFLPVSGIFTLLLLGYAALFYVYQGPPRLKMHWASSLVLNAIPLGLIIYLHPYLVTSGRLETTGIFFAVMFTFYMAFFEIAHQLQHDKIESSHSLVDVFGRETSVKIGMIALTIPALLGLLLYFVATLPASISAVAVGFTALRLYTLIDIGTDPDAVQTIRGSWHKFYSAFEGAIYVILLAVM